MTPSIWRGTMTPCRVSHSRQFCLLSSLLPRPHQFDQDRLSKNIGRKQTFPLSSHYASNGHGIHLTSLSTLTATPASSTTLFTSQSLLCNTLSSHPYALHTMTARREDTTRHSPTSPQSHCTERYTYRQRASRLRENRPWCQTFGSGKDREMRCGAHICRWWLLFRTF